jgi:hypothetical protein
MKKLLILLTLLIPSITLAADRWTGPTSPINPMWGSKGSSIMSEALRDNQPTYEQQLESMNQQRKIRALEDQLDEERSKSRDSSISIYPIFK